MLNSKKYQQMIKDKKIRNINFHTEETKNKIRGKWKPTGPRSSEVIEKIRSKLTGRKLTDQHKENLSKAKKQRYTNVTLALN